MSPYLNAWLYVVLTAISFVFIDKIGDHINPLFSLFVMSLIASIWFNIINVETIKHTYKACFNNKSLYFSMTFFIGINWLCSIYAPNRADPFVYLATVSAIRAMCGFIKLFIDHKSKHSLLSVLLLAISLLILYKHYQMLGTKNIDIGIGLGILSGISGYYYLTTSYRLSIQNNLSSTQLLAIRFWPLVLSLGLFIIYQYSFSLGFNNFIILVFMAFITLIVPIYFYQQAIGKLGVISTILTVSFVPPCAFIIYVLYNHHFKPINFVVCLIITLALIIPNLIKFVGSSRK